MAKKMTPEQARAYLADQSNFWPDDECCYACGELYGSLSVEYRGHIFCREKCCNDYIRIARIARQKSPERVLTIPIKGVYFDQIKAGTKPREYRLTTEYWRKRLERRVYNRIVLTRGYPKAADAERRLTLPWRGYEIQTITHPHFGPKPVQVFAIDVTGERACPTP